MNPTAPIIEAASPISVERPGAAGKRALVVEDGPTVTHGGMAYGAGLIAAEDNGGRMIDPRPSAVGSIADTFTQFPHLSHVSRPWAIGRSRSTNWRKRSIPRTVTSW